MKRVFYLSIILTLCILPSLAQDRLNWLKKITPYQMTIDEVEKLISAKPDKELSVTGQNVYLLKQGRLDVAYSPGWCIDGRPYGKWELEKGVILDTSFYPEKWREISFYEKDVKSLKKEKGGMYWYYDDDKRGVSYTMQHGKVYSISFTAAENVTPIRCKE